MVRDLIGGQAVRLRDLLRQLIKVCLVIVFHRDELSASGAFTEGGAFLDGQFIEREVRRTEREGIGEFSLPALGGLARAGIDEVERDIVERVQRRVCGKAGIGGVMVASKEGKGRIVQRLQADREAVHASSGPGFEVGSKDVIRIGLQRDFHARREAEAALSQFDEKCNVTRTEQGGRPAAKIDRAKLRVIGQGFSMPGKVARYGFDKRGTVPPFCGVDVEVAIGADLRTIGPVDVEPEAVIRSEGQGRAHGSRAALSLRKASARWLIACFFAGSISPKVSVSPLATKTGS